MYLVCIQSKEEFTTRKRDWELPADGGVKIRIYLNMSFTQFYLCCEKVPLQHPLRSSLYPVETQSFRHLTAWCRSSLQSCLAKGHGFQQRPSKPFKRSPVLCQAGNPRTMRDPLAIEHRWAFWESPRHQALSPRVSKAWHRKSQERFEDQPHPMPQPPQMLSLSFQSMPLLVPAESLMTCGIQPGITWASRSLVAVQQLPCQILPMLCNVGTYWYVGRCEYLTQKRFK